MRFIGKVKAGRGVRCLIVAVVLCAAASCKSPPSVEEESANDKKLVPQYIAQADQLYAQREDTARIRQAVALLKQAHAADPSNYDAAWRLSKFDYYLATHTDGDERDKAFREGIDAGKDAVRLQNDKPEGHFWLGADYGGSLEMGKVAGLATVNDVRNEMEAVLRLDEGFQDGSAYMVLGLVDLKAPKLLGGDPQKAVAEMEKGLRFGEKNAFLRLHLAEAYQAVGRVEDARKQLETIINMQPDPNYLPEYKEAVGEARTLLDKLG
ncbi:MAG: tetratricopeptide repeat protein [Pyrinomonadaceae bacterium]|nr:tetratricopeptide repeat protein [Pyrinomonadaceae bacterium]